MEAVPITAISMTILVIVFAICFTFLVVILEDNRLDPIDSYLINEAMIAGGITQDILDKLQIVAPGMGMNANLFDFSGSTIEPVQHGETFNVMYSYNIQANQDILQVVGDDRISESTKVFTLRRTGRD